VLHLLRVGLTIADVNFPDILKFWKWKRRSWADLLGLGAAVIVFAVGGFLVLGPSLKHWDEAWDRDPFKVRLVQTSQTKVTEPGTTATPGTKKTTTTTTVAADGTKQIITAVEETIATSAGGPQAKEVTTSTSEANDSLVERGLSTGGLVLLRLAIVAFAAFIAGAVVQRAVLGQFGIKLGVLELGDVAAGTEQASEEIKAEFAKFRAIDKSLVDGRKRDRALTKKLVNTLAAQIAELEKRLPAP
jgi:hypothetical protein